MDLIEALRHCAAFFAPALGIGLISAALAKWLWRHDLNPTTWSRLAAWTTAAAALTSVGGLLVVGRDGSMGTYAVMVLASALALWWVGFAAPRR